MRSGDFENLSFFESAILIFFSKNQSKFIRQNGWVEILKFSLVSIKFLAMHNITLYSVYSLGRLHSSQGRSLATGWCKKHLFFKFQIPSCHMKKIWKQRHFCKINWCKYCKIETALSSFFFPQDSMNFKAMKACVSYHSSA